MNVEAGDARRAWMQRAREVIYSPSLPYPPEGTRTLDALQQLRESAGTESELHAVADVQ